MQGLGDRNPDAIARGRDGPTAATLVEGRFADMDRSRRRR